MNEKKYSYLPNKYTIKFFETSNKEQSKFFKPLLITDNIKNWTNDSDISRKQIKNSKIKKQLIDMPLYSKQNYFIIQKRKKAINAYLKSKKNSINKKDQHNNKYINNNNDNYSSSSISKVFNNNHSRVYHSFQNSKTKKKKSNIISQIKNQENEKHNKNKKKNTYFKTDKDFYTIKKEEKNSLHDSIDKNLVKKIIPKNSVIIKSHSENKIIPKEEKYKTTEKKNKIKNNYVKDISMKDNCFNIDNSHKINNIKLYKASLNINENSDNNKNEIKNEIKNDIDNKNVIKEKKIFQPNMNIFKNITINNNKINTINTQHLTEQHKKINHIPKCNHYKSTLNINSNNYGKEFIFNTINNKDKEDNKNNNINSIQHNNKSSKNYITNNRPLNVPDIYKSSFNSELSQFTFKKKDIIKDNNNNNNQSSTLIIEKRRNELNKLINFTNKF